MDPLSVDSKIGFQQRLYPFFLTLSNQLRSSRRTYPLDNPPGDNEVSLHRVLYELKRINCAIGLRPVPGSLVQ